MPMTPTRSLLFACALTLLAASTFGCEKEEVIKKSPRSTTPVELPKKPSLTPPEYVKQHPDGVWTVEGALRHSKELMSKSLRVRGTIVDLVKCPPPKPHTPEEIEAHNKLHDKWKKIVKLAKRLKKIPPEEPVLKPKVQDRTCNPRPKAILQDATPNDRFKLLVAGSMYSPLKSFKKGQVVTLEGLFDMVTPDGHYMSQDGLMYLKDIPKAEEAIQEAPGETAPTEGK